MWLLIITCLGITSESCKLENKIDNQSFLLTSSLFLFRFVPPPVPLQLENLHIEEQSDDDHEYDDIRIYSEVSPLPGDQGRQESEELFDFNSCPAYGITQKGKKSGEPDAYDSVQKGNDTGPPRPSPASCDPVEESGEILLSSCPAYGHTQKGQESGEIAIQKGNDTDP